MIIERKSVIEGGKRYVVETLSGGVQKWKHKGQIHREEGPAVIFPNKYEEWCHRGYLHRENGPAVIHNNGKREWWIDKNIEIFIKNFSEFFKKGDLFFSTNVMIVSIKKVCEAYLVKFYNVETRKIWRRFVVEQ